MRRLKARMPNKSANTIKEKMQKVRQHFLLPPNIQSIRGKIKSAAAGSPEGISTPAKVFEENLQAVVDTTSIPFTLAADSVSQQRLHQLTISEKIRIRAEDIEKDKETPNPDEEAYKRALKKFNDECKDARMVDHLLDNTINFLLGGIKETNSKIAINELLRQAMVMTWGAFEVLSRDVFVAYLNSNPSEVQKLTADPDTRKVFQAKSVDLDVLSSFGYDISKNMGDVFANVYDLSSLGAIKQTFVILFPLNKVLHDRLRDQELWILHQRRHLIVHRRGIVDKRYLDMTGEKLKIGEQLTPKPSEIQEYIALVGESGAALVAAVAGK